MTTTTSVPKRIEAWFKLSPNVVLAWEEHVGYNPNPQGLVLPDRGVRIQGRAAYIRECRPEIGTALHEMAHMVDIDDKRVRKPGWGLKTGNWVEFPSRYSPGFWEMQTDAGIKREVRVMAIQAVITEHLGFNFDYCEWAALLSNGAIQNYCLWRNRFGLSYDDEHDKTKDNGWTSTTTRHDAEIIRSVRDEFTIEQVWTEWVRKCKVVDRQIQRARSQQTRKAAA